MIVATSAELAHKIEELEQKSAYHDGQLMLLFDVIHKFVTPEEVHRTQVSGFVANPGDSGLPPTAREQDG